MPAINARAVRRFVLLAVFQSIARNFGESDGSAAQLFGNLLTFEGLLLSLSVEQYRCALCSGLLTPKAALRINVANPPLARLALENPARIAALNYEHASD